MSQVLGKRIVYQKQKILIILTVMRLKVCLLNLNKVIIQEIKYESMTNVTGDFI